MKLGNPPIVEAWIEFHMQGVPQSVNWQAGSESFMTRMLDEYPEIERIPKMEIRVDRASGGGSAEISGRESLHRVRAFNQARRECVQIDENTLVFNAIARDQRYAGFEFLMDKGLEHLRRYREHFRPASVRSVGIHYTDLVRIPCTLSQVIRLEDYFTMRVELPDESAWPLARVALEILVPLSKPEGAAESLTLSFRSEGYDDKSEEIRFRLDWHVKSDEIAGYDAASIKQKLRKLHDEIERRFRSCFTEAGWALFKEENT